MTQRGIIEQLARRARDIPVELVIDQEEVLPLAIALQQLTAYGLPSLGETVASIESGRSIFLGIPLKVRPVGEHERSKEG